MILPAKKVPAFGSKLAFRRKSKGYQKNPMDKVTRADRQKYMKKSDKTSCTTSFFSFSGTDLHILLLPRKVDCASKGFLTDCPVWHEVIEVLQPTSTSSIWGRAFWARCVRCNRQETFYSASDTLFKPESQYPIVDIALPSQIQF